MYQNKLMLSPNDILEKEFKIDTRGYRLKEVDQFLDTVIGDYEEFIRVMKESEKEKESLLEEIMSLKQEIRNLKMSVEIARNNDSKEVSNVDVLKRLAQLEKIVYGKDE